MPNNIVIGQNIRHARQTINIAATGVTEINVGIIYCMEPDSSFSYVPGRSFNQITQFVEHKSYLIIALQEMDLSEWLYPPFMTGIIAEDGSQIVPE